MRLQLAWPENNIPYVDFPMILKTHKKTDKKALLALKKCHSPSWFHHWPANTGATYSFLILQIIESNKFSVTTLPMDWKLQIKDMPWNRRVKIFIHGIPRHLCNLETVKSLLQKNYHIHEHSFLLKTMPQLDIVFLHASQSNYFWKYSTTE